MSCTIHFNWFREVRRQLVPDLKHFISCFSSRFLEVVVGNRKTSQQKNSKWRFVFMHMNIAKPLLLRLFKCFVQQLHDRFNLLNEPKLNRFRFSFRRNIDFIQLQVDSFFSTPARYRPYLTANLVSNNRREIIDWLDPSCDRVYSKPMMQFEKIYIYSFSNLNLYVLVPFSL